MDNPNNSSGDAMSRRRCGMEAVIDTYQTPLLRYAARLLNNATLAQDVVQNAFIKLFRQWQPNMHADERLKSWLFRVVHNEAVDMIRAEERRRRHQEGHVALRMDETSGGLTRDAGADERIATVLSCVGSLPPAQRQVVLLRMQQGMSYEEISAVTGKSIGYVGNLLHKAVHQLSGQVRKMEGCEHCKSAAGELRVTLALLGDTLTISELESVTEPKLDPSSRAMLLDIQPDQEGGSETPVSSQKGSPHWFFRIHPAFKAAAALVIILSVVIMGAISTVNVKSSMMIASLGSDEVTIRGEVDGVARDAASDSSWFARSQAESPAILGAREATLSRSGTKRENMPEAAVAWVAAKKSKALQGATRNNISAEQEFGIAENQLDAPAYQTATAARERAKAIGHSVQSAGGAVIPPAKAEAEEQSQMVELKIELPKPQFTGTPTELGRVTWDDVEKKISADQNKEIDQLMTLESLNHKSRENHGEEIDKKKTALSDSLYNGAIRALDSGDIEAAEFLMKQASVRGHGKARDKLAQFSDRLGAATLEVDAESKEDSFTATGDLGEFRIDLVKPQRSEKPSTPEEKKIADKLKNIVVPEVTFRPPATLSDAVMFFNNASRDYDDPDLPVKERGVKISLNLPADKKNDPVVSSKADVAETTIPALSARFISMHDALKLVCDVTGTRFQIKGDKIEVLPIYTAKEEAIFKYVDANEAQPVPEPEPPKVVQPVAFNPFVKTAENNFSTFAIDVDTASYTLTRQAIQSGVAPEPERVRTEEIVNAFDYGDTAPEKATFRIYQDGAQSPFGPGLNMLRIGVKGRRLGREEQRPAMLTFVIDTSGSMAQPDRIGLARLALELLMDQLAAQDRIQLIAYSDHARLVLESVSASEKERVVAAFKRLQCNGSTNLEEGLQQAYAQAVQSFVPGAENRVILISDGVANLGADSAQEILNKVAASRKQGITCSVFGVGRGTYNDRMLEELANKGDGVYKFLDSAEEVKRAFVDDLAATLNTIAKDAKIQVEWNPAVVRRYRQLGYENRALTKEQFRDDTVDAGEVGSGQSVTALYELELAPDVNRESRLGTVRVRYQRTDNGRIEEIETPLLAASVLSPAHKATPSFKVAASAAEFAEQLRGSPYAAGARFQSIADYLRPAALELSLDTRVKELLDLITAMEAMQ